MEKFVTSVAVFINVAVSLNTQDILNEKKRFYTEYAAICVSFVLSYFIQRQIKTIIWPKTVAFIHMIWNLLLLIIWPYLYHSSNELYITNKQLFFQISGIINLGEVLFIVIRNIRFRRERSTELNLIADENVDTATHKLSEALSILTQKDYGNKTSLSSEECSNVVDQCYELGYGIPGALSLEITRVSSKNTVEILRANWSQMCADIEYDFSPDGTRNPDLVSGNYWKTPEKQKDLVVAQPSAALLFETNKKDLQNLTLKDALSIATNVTNAGTLGIPSTIDKQIRYFFDGNNQVARKDWLNYIRKYEVIYKDT